MTSRLGTNTEGAKDRAVAAPLRLYLLIGLVGVIVTVILGYGLYTGDRMSRVDAPLLNAIAITKLEANAANHWVEEILAGRNFENVDAIWKHLDQAVWYLRAMQEGEKGLYDDAFPVEDEGLRKLITAVSSDLAEVKAITWQRLAAREIYGFDNEVDQRYLHAFSIFTNHIDEVQRRVKQIGAKKLRHFRTAQVLLIFICVLLSFSVGLAFRRFERRRARDFLSLKETNERLEREMADRKLAEDALRESEERFRQLAENIEDTFWLADTEGERKVIYLSPAFEKLWRQERKGITEDREILLKYTHPEDQDRVMQALDEFHRSWGDLNLEFRIVWPDGSIRWIWARAFSIRNPEGKVYRVTGLAQDSTERKREEERREELFAEIKNVTYFVSHDLRAPLVNLKGFSYEIGRAIEVTRPVVQKAISQWAEGDRAEILKTVEEDLPVALDFIHSSVSRMETLINATLKLSRMGHQELYFEPINMTDLARETLKTLAYRIRESQAKVVVGDLPVTIADRVSMEQIMSNLMNNAINYLVPQRPGKIEITGESRFDENVFKVRDNGRGIDKSDFGKVFDMFQRVGGHSVAGEGMGLTYVRTLVRRHGGRIWCESEPGVGTVFAFTISKGLRPTSDANERVPFRNEGETTARLEL